MRFFKHTPKEHVLNISALPNLTPEKEALIRKRVEELGLLQDKVEFENRVFAQLQGVEVLPRKLHEREATQILIDKGFE